MSDANISLVEVSIQELIKRLKPLDLITRNKIFKVWGNKLKIDNEIIKWEDIVIEFRRLCSVSAAIDTDHLNNTVDHLLSILNTDEKDSINKNVQSSTVLSNNNNTQSGTVLLKNSNSEKNYSSTSLLKNTSEYINSNESSLKINNEQPKANSTQITNLISKLKSGEISQSQLYSQLSGLYASKNSTPVMSASNSAAQLSSSDRRAVLENLVKKQTIKEPLSEITSEQVNEPITGLSEITSRLIRSNLDKARINETPPADEYDADIEERPAYLAKYDRFTNLQNSYNNESTLQNSSSTEKMSPTHYQEHNPRRFTDSNIKRLPANISGSGSLPERLNKWKERSVDRANQLKQMQSDEETSECTFRPNVNPKSKDMFVGNTSMYQSRSKMRAKINEEETLRMKHDSEIAECTFKPNLNPVSVELAINASQRKLNSAARHNIALEESLAECTFAPRTNHVKPHMSHASSYLELNPFDRLYHGLPYDSTDNEGTPVAKSSNRSIPKSSDRFKSVKKTLFKSASSNDMADYFPSEDEEINTRASIADFESRQASFRVKKAANVQKIKASVEENYGNPILNRKSLKIATENNPNDFLGRLQQSVDKINQKKADVAALRSNFADPECTFAPQITTKAKNRKPRTAYEISKLDQDKRETKIKILMMAEEERELEGVTFRPTLNSRPASSRLQILNDPDSYTLRLQERQRYLEEKKMAIKQAEEEKELAECTFTPKTKDAPEYVKRMAQSYRINKDTDEYGQPISQMSDRSWR